MPCLAREVPCASWIAQRHAQLLARPGRDLVVEHCYRRLATAPSFSMPRSHPGSSPHPWASGYFPHRVPARRPPPCAPCSKLAVEAPCTLPIAKSPASRPGFCRVFMLTVYPRVVRRARAPNRFLARHDVRCPACFAHPRWLLANAPTHQLTLSYPRPHATVVVFVEFANALLPIRLSSLLYALLRARRVLSVVPQHSCLPLARVNTRAPARCYCVALALCPSGFTRARVCRRAVEPVLPCSTSSLPFWWSSSVLCWTTLHYLATLAVDLVGPPRVELASSAIVTQLHTSSSPSPTQPCCSLVIVCSYFSPPYAASL
jgi:hypothetical protein